MNATELVAILGSVTALAVAIVNAIASASRKSVTDLEKMVTELRSVIDTQQNTIKLLRDENDRLSKKQESIERDLKSLQECDTANRQEIIRLTDENRKLQAKVQELTDDNARLTKENHDLSARVEEMQKNRRKSRKE